MPTIVAQEEKQKTSTLPESLRNNIVNSEDEPISLPEMHAMNAKQKKDWADKNEEKLEKQEM